MNKRLAARSQESREQERLSETVVVNLRSFFSTSYGSFDAFIARMARIQKRVNRRLDRYKPILNFTEMPKVYDVILINSHLKTQILLPV
jgi:hypothetical protein